MDFTTSQSTAITTYGMPSMINAGAGSGKTRVIVEKAFRIIQSGTPPERVCAITFTKKAAAEMRERLFAKIGIQAYRAVISNWHSFAYNQILKPASAKNHQYLATLGFKNDLIILDEGEARSILTECAKEALTVHEFEDLKEAGGIKQLQNDMGIGLAFARDSRAQDAWLRKQWALKNVKREEQLIWFHKLAVWKLYESRLIELNAVDYDYMLLHAVRLLEQDTNLVAWLQNYFLAVLADEHQDCNPIQGMLLKLIVGEGKNLTMVGDEKQSIYGFRAADVGQLLNARNDYAGMKIISMAENFRSTPEIIDLANGVADLMAEDQKVTDGHMKTNKSYTGSLPIARKFYDDRQEAEFTANEIQSLIQTGQFEPKEIAILYRAKALKELVETKLIELCIDYQVVGDKDFFDAKEVKDWIAFLRFCTNSNDVMAASRSLDAANIGAKGITMRQHIAAGKATDVMDYMTRMTTAGGPKSEAKRKGFSELIEAQGAIHDFITSCGSRADVGNLMNIDPNEEIVGLEWLKIVEELKNAMLMIWDEVFKSSYKQDAMAKRKKDETVDVEALVADRRKNIEILTTRLFSYLEQYGHIADCIRELTLLVDSGDTNSNSVQLMTEHASKGLEFKLVYIIGCEDEAHFRGDDTDINEELRLFYVAITRAELKCAISCADSRLVFGRPEKRSPLRFLWDLPTQLLKWEDYATQSKFSKSHGVSNGQYGSNNSNNDVGLRVDGFKL